VHDQHEITGGQPEPLRVSRVEDRVDPGELDEVVAVGWSPMLG
jgi:hypothetical protein